MEAPHNGLPMLAPATQPLAQELAQQVQESEKYARASLFPPALVAGYVMRQMWQLFFNRNVGADDAAAALAAVPRDGSTPLARDVLARMQVELKLD